ncbi:hypothetical protein K0U07_03955 [bacterium]|nr:hypothetical protein [bacterium]
MDKILNYNDNGNAGIEVRAGSTFEVDPEYETLSNELIDKLQVQVGSLSEIETPKKNLWIILLHIFTCTSCKVNVQTAPTIRNLQRRIKRVRSNLALLAARVQELNQQALEYRKKTDEAADRRRVGIRFLDSMATKGYGTF